MGALTLTASGVVQLPAAWTTTGGAADVVLADTLDSTYLRGPSHAPDYARGAVIGLTNAALPAGSAVVGVRVFIRAKDLSSYPWDAQGRVYLDLPGTTSVLAVSSAFGQRVSTDYVGGYQTAKPGGGAWTQQALDDLRLLFTTYTDYFGSGIDFYRSYAEVLYNERPTVAPTASSPFGVSRPTLSWVVTDPEGDPQQAYDIAWFSSAQYSIGGFDPATSPATYRTGEVTSSATSFQIPMDLVNGTTYRAHMRVRQPDVSGQAVWSSWTASNTVTINVTPPAAPGLALVASTTNTDLARHQLTATKNNTESGTTLFVEYSDNGGVTWTTHPTMSGLAFTATTTLYDYEAPLGMARRYRARVVVGGTVGSAYSTVVISTALPLSRWWLKDPLSPALNMAPRISDFRFARPRPQAAYEPIGRTEHVVITEGVRAPTGSFSIATYSKAEYDALMALTGAGRVLLLQDIFGQQRYVALGETDDYELVQATDPTGTYVIRHMFRARFTWREVARQNV